jgi:HAE1 family hydrophobic/amphiphilic exporter-1
VGVVVNNGIVLIDHINNLRRRGMPRHEAVIAGCRERLRPIAMTATTTIVGLIPLAFGETGLDNMRYFPMARTIMGGLIASTALTLVVLPTYYVLMDDLGRYFKRLWLSTGPQPEPAPVEGD